MSSCKEASPGDLTAQEAMVYCETYSPPKRSEGVAAQALKGAALGLRACSAGRGGPGSLGLYLVPSAFPGCLLQVVSAWRAGLPGSAGRATGYPVPQLKLRRPVWPSPVSWPPDPCARSPFANQQADPA